MNRGKETVLAYEGFSGEKPVKHNRSIILKCTVDVSILQIQGRVVLQEMD